MKSLNLKHRATEIIHKQGWDGVIVSTLKGEKNHTQNTSQIPLLLLSERNLNPNLAVAGEVTAMSKFHSLHSSTWDFKAQCHRPTERTKPRCHSLHSSTSDFKAQCQRPTEKNKAKISLFTFVHFKTQNNWNKQRTSLSTFLHLKTQNWNEQRTSLSTFLHFKTQNNWNEQRTSLSTFLHFKTQNWNEERASLSTFLHFKTQNN